MSDELKKLKHRADIMHRIYRRFPKAYWLYRWFEAEVNALKGEGMVDAHVTLLVDMNTSTPGATLTLANTYRLRREGKLAPAAIH